MGTSAMRWLLKKSARKTMALASRMGTARGGIHVLTYHRFGNAARDPFCVGTEDFEQQMALLARLGTAVSMADVEALLHDRREPSAGAVLVTIDDGCPSFVEHALPILRRHGIPAVLFVPAGELVDGTPARGNSEEPTDRMTWEELRAVADAGVVVGSHAWTHESLGHMSLDGAREQARRSRAVLEQRLGRPVTTFAYPFGTRADYSPALADMLREAGYTSAFTSQHGAVRADSDPFMLPRVKIEGGEALWMFDASLRGGLDAWRWIDRTMWKLQAAGAPR